MSQLKITNAGLAYKDLVFSGAETQNITHFIFANIAGLNEGDAIDPNMAIPTSDIVHSQPIQRVSALDGNAVVLSAVLDYTIGDFEFNWYGAVATKADNSQVLIAVVQTALQPKTKTVGLTTGNYSVKSIVWRGRDIAGNLNVTLSALPWQLNEGEFVSKEDFDNHNHTPDDIGTYSKADIDAQTGSFEIKKNETALTKGTLHYFTAFADLQIPDDVGTKFKFVVDDSVDLSLGKCRLLAPPGKKIKVTGVESDICNIKETGVTHTVLKVNGVWKV